MGQVLLEIKNEEKAKSFLDFLRQIDFIEIKEIIKKNPTKKDKKDIEEYILNAPQLSEEELDDIENIGKEFKGWQINEF